jgi:hypothetical protein
MTVPASTRKCVYRLSNGEKCTNDAVEGSSYCENHHPQESSSQSSSSGKPFGLGERLYTQIPPKKPGGDW